ncbi:hypothetical protein [Thioalkalivibrio sp. ALE12]|uniref:hypothetical protein n=1 Tax=Thioalkalivibrio sp. ALE12 TaxID=1158170 RepID=UPI000376A880|nr:hypothetical protein [Thioalkalivibrio sp. ALE12]
MSSHVIRNEADRQKLIRALLAMELPFTVSIRKGADRTVEQNKLQRLWIAEAAEQLGDEPEEVRAYLKLRVGVPILRENHDDFRAQYDELVKPLPYEQKLALMREPVDFPVTRLMKVPEKREYLDRVYQHLSEQGVFLTDPNLGGKTRAVA